MRRSSFYRLMRTTALCFAAHTQAEASSISSAASSTAQCNVSFRYLTPPPVTTISISGGAQNISASGANLAISSCASATFAIPPQPLLTPLDTVVNAGSNGQARGSASFGVLDGRTSANSGDAGTLAATGRYEGSYDDAITLTGGDGVANFTWILNGRKFIPPAGSLANDTINVSVDGIVRHTFALENTFTPSPQSFSFARPFTSGDTINISAYMLLNTADLAEAANNQAKLDLYVQFLELDRQTPSNALRVAASGTTYAESPEPGVFFLAAAGLGLIAMGRARRGRV